MDVVLTLNLSETGLSSRNLVVNDGPSIKFPGHV
jgi:hypothetical protein